MTEEKIPKSKPTQFIINGKTCSLYGLAFNLGYTIVTPILIFGIGGVFLDKKLDSFPLFVLIGFFLAMTSALTIVFMKMKEIMAGFKKPKDSKESEEKHHKTND